MKPDQAKDVDGNEGDHIADNLDKNSEKILLKLPDFFQPPWKLGKVFRFKSNALKHFVFSAWSNFVCWAFLKVVAKVKRRALEEDNENIFLAKSA